MTKPKRFEFVLAAALQAVGSIPEARATDLAIMLAAERPVKVRKSGQRIKFPFEHGGVEERREYPASFSCKVGMDQALTAAESTGSPSHFIG